MSSFLANRNDMQLQISSQVESLQFISEWAFFLTIGGYEKKVFMGICFGGEGKGVSF